MVAKNKNESKTSDCEVGLSDLLSCPFCGGKAKLKPGWKVQCTKCGISTPDYYLTSKYAAEVWNERAT